MFKGLSWTQINSLLTSANQTTNVQFVRNGYKPLTVPRSPVLTKQGYYDLMITSTSIIPQKLTGHNSKPTCYFLFNYELPAIFIGNTMSDTRIVSLKSDLNRIQTLFNLSQEEIDDIQKELQDMANNMMQPQLSLPIDSNGNITNNDYYFGGISKQLSPVEFQEPVRIKHKCHCDFTELLRYGCKCNGI